MSGEIVLPYSKKPKPTPMEERLGVESDKRLFGCMGMGSMMGMALAGYALTIDLEAYLHKFKPPNIVSCNFPFAEDLKVRVIIPEDRYHKPVKRPAITKHTPKPGTPGSHARKPSTPKPSEKA